jgi:hypothetical protein
MKIYLSKPRYHWLSPYTICEKICFWREIDYDEPWVDRTSKILTPVMSGIMKFLDFVHPEVNYVKIDYWDTWSMDHTLSPIILPMLKQLKATKHGYGFIDDEDVPNHLRSIHALPREQWEWDGNAEARYEYVLDEMIFAFEHLVDDSWEDAYRSGEIDHKWIPVDAKGNEVPKGEHKYMQMAEGPNHTYVCDYEGIKKVNDRIDAGLKLFGKYFRTLWD